MGVILLVIIAAFGYWWLIIGKPRADDRKRTQNRVLQNRQREKDMKSYAIKNRGTELKIPALGARGFVYVFECSGPAIDIESVVVKIGYTERSPLDRIEELADSAMYQGHQFHPLCWFETYGCYEVEQVTHKKLEADKLWGELFKTSASSAVFCIEEAINETTSAEKISFTDREGITKAFRDRRFSKLRERRAKELKDRKDRVNDLEARIHAAENGDVYEQYELSQEYRNQSPLVSSAQTSRSHSNHDQFAKNRDASLYWLKMAAKNGSGSAQHRLGIEYSHGMKGIASDQSHPFGENDWDENNPLTERDLEKSIKWLGKAEDNRIENTTNELQMVIRTHNEEVERSGEGTRYLTDDEIPSIWG
jgi:hypothetical protein